MGLHEVDNRLQPKVCLASLGISINKSARELLENPSSIKVTYDGKFLLKFEPGGTSDYQFDSGLPAAEWQRFTCKELVKQIEIGSGLKVLSKAVWLSPKLTGKSLVVELA